MKLRKPLLLLTLSVFFTSILIAQQRQPVNGKVFDIRTFEPLLGVSILNKTTGDGITSDSTGSFLISAAPGDQIEASMVGYITLLVKAGKQPIINIALESIATNLGEVILVGSRSGGRVRTETPVPVDLVSVGPASLVTARNDLTSILNYAAPSFNYNKQSGSDGADHVDLATLRGLGPDQTLVLINGKRRHQTAFVAVFGTRGRGNSGTDLSAIPIGAIDRVEILRDGASAQYGSDAIAGVINIILKKEVNHFTGNAGYSTYYDKKFNPYFKKDYGQYIYDKALDGNAFTFNGNYGFALGKKGYLSLTGSFIKQDKTFRQALDTSQTSSDFMYTNIYRRAHGDGSMDSYSGFMNMEVPLSDNVSFYSFGGYSYKSSDAYAFTRNFSARPDRFPTNGGNIIDVPGIIMTASDGEQYFNPHIQTKIQDASGAAGFRGTTKNNWSWDFSTVAGNNNFHFYGDKTFNASLGPDQTHFDDGGFSFFQHTTNLNFSKSIAKVAKGMNLAFGAEYRTERYQLFAGEEASYANYNGAKASGSQGFPGYQPNDEVDASRYVVGSYVDAELDVTKAFLLGAAFRFENYSDFGNTYNVKGAMRLKVTKNFNLRGSFSTGFRAPSLAQINFSSTFTTVQGGNIAEVKIAPNYSPITKAAGIPNLKQEESMNGSFGFVWKPSRVLSVTVDGYWVNVKDRVVLSGQFSVDDNTLDPDLIAAMQNLDVSLAQFFANAVNTTNKGIDIVIENNNRLSNGASFKLLFAGNLQDMTIDKVNVPEKLDDSQDHQLTFFSDREEAFVLASAPKSRFALNVEYGKRKISFGGRLTYFGEMTLLGYGEDGLGIHPMVPADDNPSILLPDRYNYSSKMVGDLYVSIRFSRKISLNLGCDNVTNVHPDLGVVPQAKGWAFNNETGGPWDAVQMGGNGRRFFARIGFNF